MQVDDGIRFEAASVRVGTIRKEARYGGVRVDIQATLDSARIALQVDVGFGDAVTPAPPTMVYPGLLRDVPTAPLRVYPKATVVAEKLHAVCLLGLTNSRMKDYFDLDLLLQDHELDDTELRKALIATFQRRQLPVPARVAPGLERCIHRRSRQADAVGCVPPQEPPRCGPTSSRSCGESVIERQPSASRRADRRRRAPGPGRAQPGAANP